MSIRVKRQQMRRAGGFNAKPYATDEPGSNLKTSGAQDTPQVDGSRNLKTSSAANSPLLSTPSPIPVYTTKIATSSSTPKNLGMPSAAQYARVQTDYMASLHPRKRDKALLSQEMFDNVWDVLHDPQALEVLTPQFRWWVRKMFALSSAAERTGMTEDTDNGGRVVLHEGRPVALKHQIYNVLCYCHQVAQHGGRDKTTAVVREHYSWIPKELIARFVKECPTCIFRKTGRIDLVVKAQTTAQEAYSEPTEDIAAPMNSTKPHVLAKGIKVTMDSQRLLSAPGSISPPFYSGVSGTTRSSTRLSSAAWMSNLALGPGPGDTLPPIINCASEDPSRMCVVTLPPLRKALSGGMPTIYSSFTRAQVAEDSMVSPTQFAFPYDSDDPYTHSEGSKQFTDLQIDPALLNDQEYQMSRLSALLPRNPEDTYTSTTASFADAGISPPQLGRMLRVAPPSLDFREQSQFTMRGTNTGSSTGSTPLTGLSQLSGYFASSELFPVTPGEGHHDTQLVAAVSGLELKDLVVGDGTVERNATLWPSLPAVRGVDELPTVSSAQDWEALYCMDAMED